MGAVTSDIGLESAKDRLKSGNIGNPDQDPMNDMLRTMFGPGNKRNVGAPGVSSVDLGGVFDPLTEALKLARTNVRKRMQAGEGRNDTIKTLGLGDISGSNLERKTLLGY